MKKEDNITVKNWIKIADYDLETAKAMLVTKRYIYVSFMCEQCIEKLLNGLYVKQSSKTPPYTHNLIRLLEHTELLSELGKGQIEHVNILNAYYIKSRYSEQIDKLSKTLNQKKAILIFEETKLLASWLKKRIKS